MTEDDLLREAKERFKLVAEWESDTRKRFIEDVKFANGDPDNGYQWPSRLLSSRQVDQRPALTINKTRQHNLQILNDARQNKIAIKIDPVGDESTYEAAQTFEDVIRKIEDQSNADAAYQKALETTVEGGWGYWRIKTDYVDSSSFDQDIFIERIVDPLTVYMDPDIKTKEGSDARYCFIFEELPKDLFDKKYPRYKDMAASAPMGFHEETWAQEDHVRVAEYYRRTEKRDRIYALDTGIVKRSDIGAELAKKLEEDDSVKFRDVIEQEVMWYFIVGDKIAEKAKWAGKYIPVVRVIGEETIIDGRLDRKGHTRAMKDPQRMYNYWSSSAVEFVALQTKSPWTIPIESVGGLEVYWENANRENFAYLPYKSIGDNGEQLAPPQRSVPPQFSQAYLEGMQAASAELQMVSGQYESAMGEESNEKTGVALAGRQRKGDTATFHFVDNLADAIRFTGKQLIDLIPKIYDTQRVMQIVAESGEKRRVQIDPEHPQAFEEQQVGDNDVRQIFNPNVGRYDVRADVGPEFATKRQEAFQALTSLAALSPAFFGSAGDLIMKAADFPMADELAERLRNMLPPQALGGPSPEIEQMNLETQKMQKVIEDLSEQLAEAKSKERVESAQKEIDVYKAETDRMQALSKIDPAALEPLVMQLVRQALEVTGVLQNVDQSTTQAVEQA